jgi:hypothetical protein
LICEALKDDDDGVSIYLKKQSESGSAPNVSPMILKINFDAAVAYRNIDESYRSRVFDAQSERVGSLFTVNHSCWVSWLHEESYGMYKDSAIQHYAIFTLNDCIDVLSEFEPVVEWLNCMPGK